MLGRLAACALIALYCLARYGDCVQHFFVLDDWWVLRDAAAVANPLDILRPGHAGFLLYRPLTTVGYFTALRLLFGYDASVYHAAHLLVFVADALLVFVIAARLTASRLGGLVTALLYAAAPGNAAVVFWIAIFTMSGTALVVFAMIWWWLRATGAARAIGCTVLQVVGVLASEHAVVAPVLLLLLGRLAQREPWRPVLRAVAGPMLVVAAYLAAKAFYFAAHGIPRVGYEMTLDPRVWLANLGAYAAFCCNVLALQAFDDNAYACIGAAAVGGAIALAAWATASRSASWGVGAFGALTFVVAPLPVLPLNAHRYGFYIGIAAFGATLAVVALCQSATRHWRALAVGLLVAVNAVDVATHERAARDEFVFKTVASGTDGSGLWILTVAEAVRGYPAGGTVLVPHNSSTEPVFSPNTAGPLLLGPQWQIKFFDTFQPPLPTPGEVMVRTRRRNEFSPGEPLPGWTPRWAWVRELYGAGRRLGMRLYG